MARDIARRSFIATLGGAAVAGPLAAPIAAPVAAWAQTAGAVARIGFLYPGLAAMAVPRIAAVRDGMRAIGYKDAGRAEFLARSSDGDPTRLPAMAADLVAQKVDLIVGVSAAGLRAAKAATSTIPIVAHDLEGDPVASGFVASLARPGGNLTGVFADFPEIGMKWLELLKEAIPGLSSVVVLHDPIASPVQLDAVQAAGRLLNVKMQVIDVSAIAEVEGAFKAAAERRPDAVILLTSPIFGTAPKRTADLALSHRLAIASLFSEIARAGGLIGYGPNLIDAFRQAGTLVGKILQGGRPAELPVERPTKFEMVINLKTARALGLTLPPALLLRADEVVE